MFSAFFLLFIIPIIYGGSSSKSSNHKIGDSLKEGNRILISNDVDLRMDQKKIYINFIKRLFNGQPELMTKLIAFETNTSLVFTQEEVYQIIMNGIYKIESSGLLLQSLCSLFIYNDFYFHFLDIYYQKINTTSKYSDFSNKNWFNLKNFYEQRNYQKMKEVFEYATKNIYKMKINDKNLIILDLLKDISEFEMSFECFILSCMENFIFRIKDQEISIFDVYTDIKNDYKRHIFSFDIDNLGAKHFTDHSNTCVFHFCQNFSEYKIHLQEKILNFRKIIVNVGDAIRREYFAFEKIRYGFFYLLYDFEKEYFNKNNIELQYRVHFETDRFEKYNIESDSFYERIIFLLIRSYIRDTYFSDLIPKNIKLFDYDLTSKTLEINVKEDYNLNTYHKEKQTLNPLFHFITKIYTCLDEMYTNNDTVALKKIKRIDKEFFSKYNTTDYPLSILIKEEKNQILDIEHDHELNYFQKDNMNNIFNSYLDSVILFGKFSDLGIIGSFRIDAFIHGSFKYIYIQKIENKSSFYNENFSKNIFLKLIMYGYIYLESKICNINISNLFILKSLSKIADDLSLSIFYFYKSIFRIIDFVCYIQEFPENITYFYAKNCQFNGLGDTGISKLIFKVQLNILSLYNNTFELETIVYGDLDFFYCTRNIFKSKIVFIGSVSEKTVISDCIGVICVKNLEISNIVDENNQEAPFFFMQEKKHINCSNCNLEGEFSNIQLIKFINFIKCKFKNKMIIKLNKGLKVIDIRNSVGILEIISEDEFFNLGNIEFREDGCLIVSKGIFENDFCFMKNLCFSKNQTNIVSKFKTNCVSICNVSFYND